MDNRWTLTISGTGAMQNYKLLSSVPWENYKEDVTKIIIEEGVTNIGSNSFLGFKFLESVTIPNTITDIGASAFKECTSLISLDIPNSVVSIGKDAFRQCSRLTTLSIGKSVSKIGGTVIFECDNLKTITCHSPTPPEVSTKFLNETFLGAAVEKCTIIVPEACKTAYIQTK